MSFYRPPAMHEALEAIGSVYRALRAWQFYPAGHPTRRSSIIKAYNALLEILDGHDLALNCGRGGFSLPDGEELRDASSLCNSLSFELFIRRAKTITFLHDLRQDDLLDLVRVLTVPHDEMRAFGGIDAMLEQHGVSTIWANEFDLSIIRNRRQQIEKKGILPPSLDDLENISENVLSLTVPSLPAPESITLPEQELQYLIGQLVSAYDEERYLLLVRQAVACADLLILHRQESLVIPLIELLAEHSTDSTTSYVIRQNAKSALEQLAISNTLIKYVIGNMELADGISTIAASALLQGAGVHAVSLIVETVGSVKSLALRKTLNAVLAEIGEPAVPLLLSQMNDERWYIVRNICAVLGTIGSHDAIPQLLKCLDHSDIRVCKEAVRSLARLGGAQAESALVAILKHGNSRLMPQVMASLGGMKSRKALVEFMVIVYSNDLFLTNLSLKCEALAAIAMIGEPVVAPKLAKLLENRFFLAGKKGLQFKIAIVECLGKLSNSDVIPTLQTYKNDDGEFGKACSMAIENISTASVKVSIRKEK